MAPQGHHGRALLSFIRHGPRTILHRQSTSFPAQVVRPYYWEGSGRAHLYLLTLSGGMLGGDRLEIQVTLGPQAQVCLGTASATKVFAADAAPAEQCLSIELAPGSSLEYLPEPTILFRGARWRQHTVVRRAADSQLLLLEAWSAGRVARPEVFQFSSLETTLQVYTDGRLSLIDRMRIVPETYPHQALGLWEGRPHLLTLYALQAQHPLPAWVQGVEEQLAHGSVRAGLSQLETPGAVARALADDADSLVRAIQTLWRNTREGLWGEAWHPWRK